MSFSIRSNKVTTYATTAAAGVFLLGILNACGNSHPVSQATSENTSAEMASNTSTSVPAKEAKAKKYPIELGEFDKMDPNFSIFPVCEELSTETWAELGFGERVPAGTGGTPTLESQKKMGDSICIFDIDEDPKAPGEEPTNILTIVFVGPGNLTHGVANGSEVIIRDASKKFPGVTASRNTPDSNRCVVEVNTTRGHLVVDSLSGEHFSTACDTTMKKMEALLTELDK